MRIFNFIGTDTEIGKTYACCQIMRYLQARNYQCCALKPIASGVEETSMGLINPDVAHLMINSNYPLALEQVNPYPLSLAIAPHIAAQQQGLSLNASTIATTLQDTLSLLQADYVFIEGAGGAMLPLNAHETYLDLLAHLGTPIILVVGMKLGCLNHSLLTAAAVLAAKLPLSGWIANQIEPQMPYYNENLAYLEQVLEAPLIATIPHNGSLTPTTDLYKVLLCH